eukprot:374249_1
MSSDFALILMGVTSIDPNERGNAESALRAMDQTTLMQNLLQALSFTANNTTAQNTVRRLAAVLLRRCTMQESKLYIQDSFKSAVLQSLLDQTDRRTRELISHVIQHVYIDIVGNGMTWDALPQFIDQCVSSQDVGLKAVGVIMMADLLGASKGAFQSAPDGYCGVLERLLMDENLKIKSTALVAFCTIATLNEDTAKMPQIQRLLPHCMSALRAAISAHDGDELRACMGALVGAAEDHPVLFASGEAMGEFMRQMRAMCADSEIDHDIRRLALEFAVEMSDMDGIPTDVIVEACSMAFGCLMVLEEIGDMEWVRETEKYDSADDPLFEGAEIAIDRICECLGTEGVWPILKELVVANIENADWKARHAAVYVVGQATEYIDVEEANELTEVILKRTEDPVFRVKVAAMRCLSLLASYVDDEWAQGSYARVIPVILGHMEPSSGLHRLLSASAHSLGYMAQDLEPEALEPMLDQIWQSLCQLLMGSGAELVQLKTVEAMGMVAQASEDKCEKYYATVAPMLIELLGGSLAAKKYNFSAYAVEALSLLSRSVGDKGGESARKVVEQTKQLLGSDGKFPDCSGVNLGTYVLEGWRRSCKVLKSGFVPYLEWMVPVAVQCASVSHGFEEKITLLEAESDDDEETFEVDGKCLILDPSIVEQKVAALELLATAARLLPADFLPRFTDPAISAALPAAEFVEDDDVSEGARDLITAVIEGTKELEEKTNGDGGRIAVLQQAISTVVAEKLCDESKTVGVQDNLVSVLVSVIEACEQLYEPEFTAQIFGRLFAILEESLTTVKTSLDMKDSDDEDEIEEHDNLAYSIARCLGYLGATQTEQVFNTLFNEKLGFLEQLLLSDHKHLQQAAVYIMMRVVQKTKQPDPSWCGASSPILKIASSSSDEILRTNCIFCLGVMAQRYGECFHPVAGPLAELCAGLVVQLAKKRKKTLRSLGDTAAGVLARIYANHRASGAFDSGACARALMSWLPVRQDKDEAEHCYGVLCDGVKQNDPQLLGQNMDNLPRIIEIFGRISPKSEVLSKELKERIQLIIREFATAPADVQQRCLEPLSQTQRKRITHGWPRAKWEDEEE